jgi:dihydroorotate dehydrogenase electron transfer subunit
VKQLQATVVLVAQDLGPWHLLGIEAPPLSSKMVPGQFVMAQCQGAYLRRPLFIYQQERERVIFLFHPNDPGLTWLSRLSLGDTVDILGPLGQGFDLSDGSRNILLIWGGGEVAPPLAMAQRAYDGDRSITFLAEGGAPDVPTSLLPVQAEYHLLEEGESLAPLVRWADQVFASGSFSLYGRLREAILETEARVRPGYAQVLVTSPMNCGLGVCGGCTVETRHGNRQVCRDGPTFDLRELSL